MADIKLQLKKQKLAEIDRYITTIIGVMNCMDQSDTVLYLYVVKVKSRKGHQFFQLLLQKGVTRQKLLWIELNFVLSLCNQSLRLTLTAVTSFLSSDQKLRQRLPPIVRRFSTHISWAIIFLSNLNSLIHVILF